MSSGYSNTSVKMRGRDEGGEQSAEHAAERHPQVELGEIARLRAVQVQRPMRDEGGEEEGRDAGAGS